MGWTHGETASGSAGGGILKPNSVLVPNAMEGCSPETATSVAPIELRLTLPWDRFGSGLEIWLIAQKIGLNP
jgi:hypothetical protein